MTKRAVLLFGAGASVEYKAPSTAAITAEIEAQVVADEWMKACGGDKAYQIIKGCLQTYLQSPDDVNFEHIYHCAHELSYMFSHSDGAMNEFRPLLPAFTALKEPLDEWALRALCGKITEVIYHQFSAACDDNPLSLAPLSKFLEKIRRTHVTRIYTTNYDDFILQAVPDLYTGFPNLAVPGPQPFELRKFWDRRDDASVFYLHGSVHFGFPHPMPEKSEIGDLYWFHSRAEARKHARFDGSDVSRMDGTQVMRTSVVTGLDKLSRLQQRPMSHFYASLATDLMQADVIYVVGSGLTDLHLNSWLREARSLNPVVPLLFVDYWTGHFLTATAFDYHRKESLLFHELRVHARGPFGGERVGDHWTLSPDGTSAIWDNGFQSFLAAPDELDNILLRLKFQH
ncbi:SIR2 family protein [Ochrobactrum sp. BTU1]|nr:SIR2 family protein [Ochrobactrum sp. BTU1]